jgi:hypothetical protein
MKDKIIVWLDSNLIQFSMCYYLQKKIDVDFFAIIDVTDKTRIFYENQNLVNFKKIWFYHDNTLPIKDPDLDYLLLFEKKYDIELWKLAINDRIFHDFNDFHNFSKNEILSILENECKFFELVLNEVQPNYLIMHEPYQHQDELFFELSKSKKIPTLAFFFSTLGYRCEISQNVHYADDISNMKKKINYRNFDELRKYYDSLQLSSRIKKANIDPFGNKTNILTAAIDYLFKTKQNNTKTHYSYFGHSKSKAILNAISNSIKTKLRWRYLNKNLAKNINLEKKFIYFPLHIEQERSTLIATPFYTNDIEFIKNIAKSIPIDHLLYVKEHPAQLTRHWRDKTFYETIASIPNVIMIHPFESSINIIKNCSMVITKSGTAALEASFYEKPAITCADFDYTLLPSVERLEKIEDLPKLITNSLKKKIESKTLDEYVTFKNENTFEFDGTEFDINSVKKFFHGGRLADVSITDDKMMEFLNENKEELQVFAKEYAKKIQCFKEKVNDRTTREQD